MTEIFREGSAIQIKLDGDLTSTKNVSFETDMIAIINDESPKEVIVDLDGVRMVDSFGIKGIFAINNAINDIKGSLKLINVSEDIFGLFKYMRMDTHMEISTAS